MHRYIVTLERNENDLKDANDYITRRLDCWMGYAWKALALDDINKKLRPELVDKVSAEMAAALAFYHNDDVFSDSRSLRRSLLILRSAFLYGRKKLVCRGS